MASERRRNIRVVPTAFIRIIFFTMHISDVKNSKLEFCKRELQALLRKLVEGNYHVTAEFIYDHVANSGVEMKINPSLVDTQTMEAFLAEK